MTTLELELRRTWFTDTTTISTLHDVTPGKPPAVLCFVLEDTERINQPKIPTRTAIPRGRYEITITKSERFSKLAGHDVFLPLLNGVPNFSGIRIHPGNGAKDTEGCLLPGLSRTVDQVLHSRDAFDLLFAQLKAHAGPMFITITGP